MALIRTFTRQQLTDLGLPDRLPPENVLLDEMFNEYRWEIEHRMIFRAPDDNQIYEIYYRTPTTLEGEGEDPWNDQVTVEATLVEQRTVFTTEWRPAGSPQKDDEVNLGIDEAITKGLKCAVCLNRITYIDAPHGGWWAHARHPEDGHDAHSLIWGSAPPPWTEPED